MKGIIDMSYNLGRDEMFWRIGNEKSKKLLEDEEKFNKVFEMTFKKCDCDKDRKKF